MWINLLLMASQVKLHKKVLSNEKHSSIQNKFNQFEKLIISDS